ncbi:phospholipase A2 [Metarhizium album ARSEF 1941]|uniref:1-alkyl-2-acetylglycerophosphocholine esterase n=1 Tax=Metarhizium album (strain ARSEF 1941) TaxID=1081103 RepID=A0A0B2WLA5_METAS|nr:phospholipase A2 [Metarhizium album ARSEF 1941]KHN94723.1 phospholipase A2 [Metarhizium album ARSEF 1941]
MVHLTATPTETSGKSAITPRKTLRERFLHRLPNYNGPYNVGYMDIELPARDPRPISNLKRGGKPVLRLDTVLMGIYYPCDLRKTIEQASGGRRDLRRVNWMPAPRIATANGYAKFLNIPAAPVTAYLACTSLYTKLPAFRNAQLAEYWAKDGRKENAACDKDDGGRDSCSSEKPTFPVVIFTHGLGGSRLCYSTICGELASFGFIVVAVEHRDGSGARTLVNLPEGVNAAEIESSTAEIVSGNDEEHGSRAKNKKVQGQRKYGVNPYYIMDYILPKDNAQDTSPHNPRGVDSHLRNAQVQLRLEEIKEAYHVLSLLNDGRGDEIARLNLRKKGNIGSSSKGLTGITWDSWKGSMFLDKVTAMGHSFGGATTIQLCRDQSLAWLGQGVILDAWGQGTPARGDGPGNIVAKPMIAISSEAFMHWKENFERVVGFCQEARESKALCWMLTIVGSTHLAMTDFAVLYPHWMSLFMKSMVNPLRACSLTMATSLEFLSLTLPPGHIKHKTWVDENLLLSAPAPSEPEEALREDHAPDRKWVAVRLKIPNEFSKRFRAWWRRLWRTLVCAAVEGDATGNGLDDYTEQDELWTHISPREADVASYRTSLA